MNVLVKLTRRKSRNFLKVRVGQGTCPRVPYFNDKKRGVWYYLDNERNVDMIHFTNSIAFDEVLPEYRALLPRLSELTGCDGIPLLYDIETTGLSHQNSFVYLIGAGLLREDHLEIHELFAESPADEPEILEAFRLLLTEADYTIQYNGSSFDQPFLKDRSLFFGIPDPLENLPSLDLYRVLKEYRNLLGLSTLKQKAVEQRLDMPKRVYPDGKAGIRLYFRYLKEKDPEILQLLTGHNEEDLRGLCRITALLALEQIKSRGLLPLKAERLDRETICFTCHLEVSLPLIIEFGLEDYHLTFNENTLLLTCRMKDGRLKRYYSDHKNYDFIPSEDTVIPKAISQFMDKSLRTPAKPENCYVWFEVNESFLFDPEEQRKYLTGLIPVLLRQKHTQ